MTMPFRLTKTFACAIVISITAADVAVCGEYSPIDCNRADDAAQKAICRDYSLGQAEARMATLYSIVTSMVGMGQRAEIQDAQRDWIKGRDSCAGDKACLGEAYARRINTLNAAIADIASHGPF